MYRRGGKKMENVSPFSQTQYSFRSVYKPHSMAHSLIHRSAAWFGLRGKCICSQTFFPLRPMFVHAKRKRPERRR